MLPAPPPESRSGAQSVERALSVLRTFETETDLGITEIAERTGLTVSTAHRLARALLGGGLLIQDASTERYRLGPTLIVLGRRAETRLGYAQALGVLEDLALATGESVNLGIRSGNQVMVVLDVASNQPLRFDQEPGTRVPIHTSAMGKCLLARGGDLDLQLDALGELVGVTNYTITDRHQLRHDLELVRERGWALNDEERNLGVRAVAMPVLDPFGQALGAIAIQGPMIRITDDLLPHLVEALTRAAERIAPILAATS